MPPQDSTQPPAETAPQNFDFMLKQQPPAATGGTSPSRWGKPAKILVVVAVVLIVAVAGALFLGGGGGPSRQVVDLMAQNQEIIRVSQAQNQQFRDPNTKGLAATTQESMSSQQIQFAAYLSKNHVKYSDKELALKTNKNTDTQLQAAAQNNSLDSAYAQYLKGALTTYQNSLSEVFKTTKSVSLKSNLQSAYDSVQTLLQSPQFKS